MCAISAVMKNFSRICMFYGEILAWALILYWSRHWQPANVLPLTVCAVSSVAEVHEVWSKLPAASVV